eukprot:c16315_g1_i1.p2 GENE.c16315_g1_i1~~c16315_g1_i1.p2  ORF type:complete len:185 (-),score=-60.54 c16315_g1_i1:294-848(-)
MEAAPAIDVVLVPVVEEADVLVLRTLGHGVVCRVLANVTLEHSSLANLTRVAAGPQPVVLVVRDVVKVSQSQSLVGIAREILVTMLDGASSVEAFSSLCGELDGDGGCLHELVTAILDFVPSATLSLAQLLSQICRDRGNRGGCFQERSSRALICLVDFLQRSADGFALDGGVLILFYGLFASL